MKDFYFSLVTLLVIIIITTVHIGAVTQFKTQAIYILKQMDNNVENDKLSDAIDNIDQLSKLLSLYKTWFSITLDTDDLSKPEISIAKMRRFLELQEIADFYADYTDLYYTIDTLPFLEGVRFHVIF